MADFTSLNGYNVKDEQARANLETLDTTVNTDHENRITDVETNLETLDTTVNTDHEGRITNLENSAVKKYGFMGDSYGDGFTPDGNVTSWITLLANKLGLESGTYISSHLGGVGFSAARPDYNYINLLNNLVADNNLTDFYVCGGYNDQGQTEENIITGIANFNTAFKLKFPNAKLHIGMIGWSKNSDKITKLRNVYIAYKKGCENNDIDLLIGCEFALHNYFSYFSSDGIHPNLNGQKSIANALYNCINNGNANVVEAHKMYISGDNVGIANCDFDTVLINGNITVSQNNTNTGAFTFTEAITVNGNNFVEIGDITGGLIVGTDKNDVAIKVPVVVYSGSTYSHEVLQFLIKNGKLYVGSPHASGGAYTSLTIKAIQLVTFNGNFNALTC